MLTSLLDHEAYPAAKIIEIYHQRWELEIAFDEVKTHMLHRKEALRSKKPELVRQEFWGMILAHYLVRKMMAQAALDKKRDPDELSCEGSIEIIKSTQTGSVLSISP